MTELQQIEERRNRIRYISEASHALNQVVRAREQILNAIPTYELTLLMESIERIKKSIDQESRLLNENG